MRRIDLLSANHSLPCAPRVIANGLPEPVGTYVVTQSAVHSLPAVRAYADPLIDTVTTASDGADHRSPRMTCLLSPASRPRWVGHTMPGTGKPPPHAR